ncbi:MAG: succinate dehydrogenase cytochrome b subunit [Planctomycetota bacterium]
MPRLPLPRTSVSKKLVLSATGLWLCLFLVVHLAGNTTLFLPEERARPLYNAYTAFMTSNPLIQLVALVNYAAIVVHAAVAALLAIENRRARPVPYAFDRPGATSPWYARRMGVLGALILAFLVLHMSVFWYRYKFGALPLDADGRKDMYGVVEEAFRQPWYAAVYVASMVVLGFHLVHGASSAVRTLGLHHGRYWTLARAAGVAFAVIVSLAFAAMPVHLCLNAS